MMYTPRIISTSEAGRIHGLKILVYGRASAGKTLLCSTAPAPFIISAEAGMLTLRKHNLPCVEITTFKEFEDVGMWLFSSHEAKQFATACIDSATDIAATLLTAELKSNKDGRKAYGAMNGEILRVLRNYRNLPNHNVFFTAHQDWDTDQMSGRTSFRPGMPGKTLTQEIPYLFDEIFQLHVWENQTGQQQRALRTRMDIQYDAKDRSGSLDAWEPPDLAHVFSKILRA